MKISLVLVIVIVVGISSVVTAGMLIGIPSSKEVFSGDRVQDYEDMVSKLESKSIGYSAEALKCASNPMIYSRKPCVEKLDTEMYSDVKTTVLKYGFPESISYYDLMKRNIIFVYNTNYYVPSEPKLFGIAIRNPEYSLWVMDKYRQIVEGEGNLTKWNELFPNERYDVPSHYP